MVEQKNQFTSQQQTTSLGVPITKTDPLIQPTLSSAEKVFPTGEHSIKSNVSPAQLAFPTGDASMKGNVIPPSTVVHPPVFGTGLSGDIGTSLPSKPSISTQSSNVASVGKTADKTSISVGAPVFAEQNKMKMGSAIPPAPPVASVLVAPVAPIAPVAPSSSSMHNTTKVIPPAPTAPMSSTKMMGTSSTHVGANKTESVAITTGVPQPISSEEKVSKLGKIKSAIKSKLHKKREENAEASSDTSSVSSVSSEEGEGKSKLAKAALGIGSAVGAATVAAGVVATGAVGVASAAVIGSAISKKNKEAKDVEAYHFVGSGNMPSTGVMSSTTSNLQSGAPIAPTGMGLSATSGMGSTQMGSGIVQTGLGSSNTSSMPSVGLGVTAPISATGVAAPITTTATTTSIPSSANMMGTTFATLSSAPTIGQATSQNVLINPGISSTTLPTNANASLANNKPLSDQYLGKFINK